MPFQNTKANFGRTEMSNLRRKLRLISEYGYEIIEQAFAFLKQLLLSNIRHSQGGIFTSQSCCEMPRTRRDRTRLPHLHFGSKIELNRASVDHDITMLKPILRPILAVYRHGLNIVAVRSEVVGHDLQSAVAIDCHVDVREPRRAEQIDRLGDYRIDAEHLPNEPAIQSTGVAVAWHAIICVVEAAKTSAQSQGLNTPNG